MPTHFLDLDFRKPAPKFAARPRARIYVKNHYHDENFARPIISAKCVSFTELDQQIRRLENELKAIRQKAKKKFESHLRAAP